MLDVVSPRTCSVPLEAQKIILSVFPFSKTYRWINRKHSVNIQNIQILDG